jgi:phage tail sheath gpL-like
MSGSITFDQIPANWRVPGTYVEVRPDYSNAGLAEFPTRVLLIVQKLAAGTAPVDRTFRITRVSDAIGLFGQGSVGHHMVEAFLAANPTADLHAMCLADVGGGTQATRTVTITGNPTVAGVAALYVAGRRVTANVTTASTPTTVAAALVAAVTADPDMPVTAANTAGVITLTARHRGEVGNEIDVRMNLRTDDATPAGLAFAIAAGTAGATNPDLATAISVVASEWFTDIVVPWTDTTNVGLLVTELARRYNAMTRLDAHGWIGLRGTFSAVSTRGQGLNSPHLTAIGANAAPQPGYVWAAALAGVASFHLGNDPARQLRSLVLPRILPPAAAVRFIDTERDLLLRDGISTFTVAVDGSVVLERVITTYQTTPLAAPDTAWLDVMIPKTLTRIRWDWGTHMALTWPRAKLAVDGDIAAEYAANVATPRRLHSTWAARCKLYAREGWIENVEATLRASTFAIDGADRNRVNALMKVQVIGNLMVLAGALEFAA